MSATPGRHRPQHAPPELAPFWPDLLRAKVHVAVDRRYSEQLFREAFTTGDSDQMLAGVMNATEDSDSHWQGSDFAEGLEIDRWLNAMLNRLGPAFSATCNRSYIRRLLCLPPQLPADRDFRRSVQTELQDDAAIHQAVVNAHARLIKLRHELQVLDGAGALDSNVRRCFILKLIHDHIVETGKDFAHARSGLGRLHAYAAFVAGTPAFRHLEELLDYESNLGQVEFTMRLGADGRIHQLWILGRSENRKNRYYSPPMARLWTRLRLWLLGYQISGTGLSSTWIDQVFSGLCPYLPALLQTLADLEFHLVGSAFRVQAQNEGMTVSLPELEDTEEQRQVALDGMFNPLLLASGQRPVPTALVQGARSQLIVTGPNSGGKTRLLQAMGWTQLLAELGFFAPVARAQLNRSQGLFISLIEGSLSQHNEGRLGAELLRIRRLFESARPGVLVLLDELCSGTNPSEAEEIFLLVLDLLDQLGSRSVVATHFLDFATRLASRSGDPHSSHDLKFRRDRYNFLQVEVDQLGHSTYQFIAGIASSSMARQIATRLGLDRGELEALVAKARATAQKSSAPQSIPREPAPKLLQRGDCCDSPPNGTPNLRDPSVTRTRFHCRLACKDEPSKNHEGAAPE